MKEYYKTKESVSEYIKLAEGHNGGQLIKKLNAFLPNNSYLLEIGSGPGTDWKILSDSYEVVGSDFSDEFLKRLKVNHPNAEFLELDASTLVTNKKFDGIYSNKVLHHLKDEALEASVRRQHALLNKDGIICHSFWKGEGSEIFKGLFVNYHTKDDLVRIFDEYFDVLFMEEYEEFEAEDSILLIAKRK